VLGTNVPAYLDSLLVIVKFFIQLALGVDKFQWVLIILNFFFFNIYAYGKEVSVFVP
jgi:hypothetical protein